MNDPNDKGRYWAGLIYPGDSCPEDWEKTMKLCGLKILVSPLHDQDLADAKTGELKKPHRHVIAMWPNTTTRRNAMKFFAQFNGPETILRLENPRGMARYLIHMDDPDKAQYKPEDVIEFNGADWKLLALAEEAQTLESSAVVKLITDNDEIKGYYHLYKFCQRERPDLLDFVMRHVMFCREMLWSYLNSEDYKARRRAGLANESYEEAAKESGKNPDKETSREFDSRSDEETAEDSDKKAADEKPAEESGKESADD